MTLFTLAPSGGATDVCWHEGWIYACWQAGRNVEVGVFGHDGSRVGGALFTCSDGAFPRITSAAGSWWLLFRNATERAELIKDGKGAWMSEVTAGGNDPCCFGQESTGHTSFAWQKAPTNDIMSALVGWPAAQLPEGDGRPTGLSHIDKGRVVLVDDARGAETGMTRPCYAGKLVIGEHPKTGAIVRHPDGRVLHLWAGEDAYVPRLAHDAQTGLYAAVTHGQQGVRLAVFSEADLALPAPAQPPTWDAIGTAVNCAPFFDIQGSTIPRTSSDDQVWQAHRRGDEVHIVKGANPRFVEILRLTPDDVRLAYDATDGRFPLAWRLDVRGDGRSDVKWCPAIAELGWTSTYDAQLVRRSNNAPSTTEPFPFTVAIESHGQHIDMGGDVGVVDAVLVTRFEPHAGKTLDGYHELHWWAQHAGRALGLVRYDEMRHSTTARSFSFTRYAPERHVEPSTLIILPIPDAPVTPTPSPEPVPMSWYTDADATAFGQFLTAKYTSDMGRADVDVLGWVRWTMDWSDLRDSGATQARALAVVNRRINAVVGLPDDQWPAGVERPPDPFR